MNAGSRKTRVVAGAIAAVLVVALGGGLLMQATKSPHVGLPGTQTASASASPGKTTVVWFMGLGPGENAAELDFVSKYNATNSDNIHLELDIPPAAVTDSTIDDLLAGTDILGPFSLQNYPALSDRWLGLDELIAKNHTDLSEYPPAFLATFQDSTGQYLGLPYDEYPAFIYYNKDIFKAAGLPDLPTEVGQKYMGQDWTWDELTTIARRLTVDTSGKKSTDPGFNPAKIQTFGFDAQWVSDLRRFATPWGAGSYVTADGKTAQIPAVWKQASEWYYDAMWVSHFALTGPERTALAGDGGKTVATGRVAMDLAWTWGIDSFGPLDASGNPIPASTYKHWDMGVLPSNNGVTTNPIDTDAFVINKKSKVPDAAYTVILKIMADPKLMAAYGAMPLAQSMQAAYFETTQAYVDKQFANNPLSWSAVTDMTKYATSPTGQDPMPNFDRGSRDDRAFYTKLQIEPRLNLAAEIAKFRAMLQADFDAPQ